MSESAPKRPGDYIVGKGKPPAHTQFKPGQSGNPKGRPKGRKSFAEIARDILNKRITAKTSVGDRKITFMEALLWRHTQNALQGDTKSLAAFLRLSMLSDQDGDLSDATALTADDQAIINDFINGVKAKE